MNKKYLLMSMLCCTPYAHASFTLDDCTYTTNETTVQLPARKISLDPNAPIGTLFYAYTASIPSGSGTMHCDGSANQKYQQSYLIQAGGAMTTVSGAGTFPANSRIYKTNIPGVGVVISKGSTKVLPITNAVATLTGGVMPVDFRYTSLSIDINLIKYDDIPGGPHIISLVGIPSVEVSTEFVTGTDTVTRANAYTSHTVTMPINKPFVLGRFNFGAGAVEILSSTCDTPDSLVDLGKRNINNVTYREGGDFATPWVDASIHLTNCPVFYGVGGRTLMTGNVKNNVMTLTLIPNNTTTSNQGIMPINTVGYAASGVGIQLAYGTTAVNTKVNFATGKGTKTYTLSPSIGSAYTLPLVARYVQTASSINDVQPGAANGKVTYLINYF
ncbi:MAG: hypothetical protein E6470_06125 [Enterobacteriaceae bacterium]|nr:hypothetical protein [Enterobacteriaceae bacterium]